MATSTVFLVGMPGAGKSTLGVQLAKLLALNFIDTDILIQQRVGMSLQDIVNQHDYLYLRAIEEQVLLDSDFGQSVVATGGSVVYSNAGMQRLQSIGPCIYLRISYETLLTRVLDESSRGLAVAPGTDLRSLYDERLPMYEQWATITIDCNSLSQAEILQKICERF